MPPLATLPERTRDIDPLDWATIGPRYAQLEHVTLTQEDVPDWILRWSDLKMVVWEGWSIRKGQQERDLTDEANQTALQSFIDDILTPSEAADRALARKLLSLQNWQPEPQHQHMLRRLRAANAIGTALDPQLDQEIAALVADYGKLGASLNVVLDGEIIIGPEYDRLSRDADRSKREMLWRATSAMQLERRAAYDDLLLKLLAKRRAQAKYAGQPHYRALYWLQMARTDYTAEDCAAFHDAVASEVVPLAARRHDARRLALGLDTLRPWDLTVTPEAPLPSPFPDADALETGMVDVFGRVDPELGALFSRMRRGYLDLGWRQGKRDGGVERPFPVSGIPYVLVNADGTDGGIKTLMHEMGHAFHDHLTMRHTTLQWDLEHFDEFSEVASFGLYHLAAPFLGSDLGGPLAPEDAARSHARFLDEIITSYLPMFARGDTFQHWLYADAPDDVQVDELDAKWRELTARFKPWIDWRGLEAEAGRGWQSEWSLFTQPFYDIAYALSLLGSLHVWRNAQTDRAATWQTFRAALALGNTRTLPELYAAAGARLPFERAVVRETVLAVAQWLDRTPG